MNDAQDDQRPANPETPADDAFDIAETYAAQSDALKEVWDDPVLDVYEE